MVLGEIANSCRIVVTAADKGIRYQQNLTGRKIALAVLSQERWGPVRQRLEAIADAIAAATAGSYLDVELPLEQGPRQCTLTGNSSCSPCSENAIFDTPGLSADLRFSLVTGISSKDLFIPVGRVSIVF